MPAFRIPVIIGPTASGKTRIAVELALKHDGEVVSADSMLVYRKMDIGTAKPDAAEMRGVPHHMIGVADPCEDFSVARYKEMAETQIDDILSRGRLPIVAGGTGLYVSALVRNIEFAPAASNDELREALKREAAEFGNARLHEKLSGVDPEAAARLHPNDVKRVIRALEVHSAGNGTITEHDKKSLSVPPKHDYAIIGLNVDRPTLYRRIDARVDEMVAEGFEGEVRSLVAECGREALSRSTAMQGLGYREFLRYLDGDVSFDDAVANIKRDTRHFAKRQFTWFRKIEGVKWIDIGPETDFGDIMEAVDSALAISPELR